MVPIVGSISRSHFGQAFTSATIARVNGHWTGG
jgi:hypothetical protein